MKKIAILGSTGSIGRSTLDVIKAHPGSFDVVALSAGTNVDLMVEQFKAFRPAIIGMVDEQAAKDLSKRLSSENVKIVTGAESIIDLASLDDIELVVNAIVGFAGLRASLKTVESGKSLALANKESLVAGGPLFEKYREKAFKPILPIDSEHSAIWQALSGEKINQVKKIILTASGGPFRSLNAEAFDAITPEMALAHPTWKMGRKITIDSATLANKGLEVIEAVTLFGIPAEKIQVVIHPQSIIHSMVEYLDSSIIAQLSQPDMRLPITYALFWPDRVESNFGAIDPTKMTDLTFEPPDYKRFPMLQLAFEAAKDGGTAPAIYNAANEIAVEAFLNGRIKFTEFDNIIRQIRYKIKVVPDPNLEDIIRADRQARIAATEKIEELACC